MKINKFDAKNVVTDNNEKRFSNLIVCSCHCRTRKNAIFFVKETNDVFFKFRVEVGVEESIVNAPPDYNSDQLFKSNLTFCVVCVFNLQFEKAVFLRRVVSFTIDSSTPTSTPN
jgi:hypothetical protein